jgi:protein FrlC
VKKSVDLAHTLGAKVVESESGPGRIVEDDPVEELNRTKEAYIELAEYASKYDITIGQEASRNPLVRQSHVIENIKQSIQLVKEINHKNLRVLLDTAHTAQDPIMGIPEAIDLSAPWLVHVHCSDSPLTYHEHMPIGDGKINWEAVITALKRIDFDKFVTLELGFVADPIGDAEKARNIFEQYMQ